jgi:hypothetical protein
LYIKSNGAKVHFRLRQNKVIFKFKKIGVASLMPIVVLVIAYVVGKNIGSSEDLWIKADFEKYKKQREEVVAKVFRGELKLNIPGTDLVALGNSYPLISRGGNEIVVKEHQGNKYVIFFTRRGILNGYYTGIYYVPQGGDPRKLPENFNAYHEGKKIYITPLEGNWFYVDFR